jgi:RNA polymerase sigma-70 factor (ECF subfamily)
VPGTQAPRSGAWYRFSNRSRSAREDGPVETATRVDESALVAALRAGDERAFMELVEAYTPGMRRLALTFVRTPAVADEVVQEAWLGVLRGLDRFEGRSSLKTWIYRIVANVARTRAVREARSAPFSSLTGDVEGASVDPDRFQDGHWGSPIEPWQQVLDAEAREVVERAIAELPEQQRRVIELRDVLGFDSEEVCNVLELSETNQRVLLHRARTKVRMALERYLGDGR